MFMIMHGHVAGIGRPLVRAWFMTDLHVVSYQKVPSRDMLRPWVC